MSESPRLPPIPEFEMDEAQRCVRAEIAAGARGGVRGPFDALLRSPELADRMQKLGAYVRFEELLPARLNELAILVTARHWGAQSSGGRTASSRSGRGSRPRSRTTSPRADAPARWARTRPRWSTSVVS